METMYRPEILEIYSEKPNYGELKTKTHEFLLKNPGCEDIIKIDLEIKDGKVVDARFSGKTCFISQVSASVILDNIKGMETKKIMNLGKVDVDGFLGMSVISTRVGCELFPLEAVKRCLKNA